MCLGAPGAWIEACALNLASRRPRERGEPGTFVQSRATCPQTGTQRLPRRNKPVTKSPGNFFFQGTGTGSPPARGYEFAVPCMRRATLAGQAIARTFFSGQQRTWPAIASHVAAVKRFGRDGNASAVESRRDDDLEVDRICPRVSRTGTPCARIARSRSLAIPGPVVPRRATPASATSSRAPTAGSWRRRRSPWRPRRPPRRGPCRRCPP